MVHGLEEEFEGRLKVMRVDVDEPASQPLLREHRVPGTPFVVVLDARGEEKLRRGGTLIGQTLRADILALLGG